MVDNLREDVFSFWTKEVCCRTHAVLNIQVPCGAEKGGNDYEALKIPNVFIWYVIRKMFSI